MAEKPYAAPHLASGYTGEQDRGAPAEHKQAPTPGGTTAGENRGAQAPSEGSGGVTGSGAGAGGGGGPEEYDSDPQAGGGMMPTPASSEPRPTSGADAPQHNSS